MKKSVTYDLKDIYQRLISNEIPQSFVNDVLKNYSILEQTEEEKIFSKTATAEKIFFRSCGR